ncbi:SIR2 family protein (plasmid) [Rhizobium leguminosarum]
MAFDPNRIPQRLKADYRNNRVAVLVGAGASIGAGLPKWDALLERMIAAALSHHVIGNDRANDYRQLLKTPSNYLLVASGLKEDLGSHFDNFIIDTFVVPKPKPTSLHKALVEADRLQFVLTTNYDSLLEKAFRARDEDVSVYDFTDTGAVQRSLSQREFFILKAHGDAQKIGNGIILTEGDYRNILYRQRAYQSLLFSMFTMYTLVFVGASMTDPEVRLLLGYIAEIFTPSGGPTHYALMTQEDVTEVEKTRWMKDSRVQFVPVSKTDDYAELTDFVRALHAQA